jgi:hypothetical protein
VTNRIGGKMATAADSALGETFATALGHKDFERIRELLHPEIDFTGMTPSRSWRATGVDEVIDGVLSRWFEPGDVLEEIVEVQTGAFADRRRVGYRFAGHNDDGPFIVEQQAYYAERDGRIGWMRVVCSGFRPA